MKYNNLKNGRLDYTIITGRAEGPRIPGRQTKLFTEEQPMIQIHSMKYAPLRISGHNNFYVSHTSCLFSLCMGLYTNWSKLIEHSECLDKYHFSWMNLWLLSMYICLFFRTQRPANLWRRTSTTKIHVICTKIPLVIDCSNIPRNKTVSIMVLTKNGVKKYF